MITGVPNHPRGVLFPGYRNRLIQEERLDGIRVLRTWTYLTANEGFLRRSLNYALFGLAAVVASFKSGPIDVVIATSPQFFAGVAGLVVSAVKRRRFVLEVRDLWPDSIVQLGQLRNRWMIRLLEGIERGLYRAASGIVVNTRAFIDHITMRGVPRERLALVYNGIDPRLFHPQPRDIELLRTHSLEGKFLVAYIGTLGLAHGLTTVLDAAEKLEDETGIVFLMIGDGADRQRLENEISKRALPNVRLLGLRPRAEIPAWLASIDVALVLLRDLPVFETVIPSKLFEFLAQERPVVLAARGEVRALLEGAKAGFAIEPEDGAALARAVLYVRDHPDESASRARTGREWVETNFQRDTLAREMLAFLMRVSGAAE